MSNATEEGTATTIAPTLPVVQGVRMYVAPVERTTGYVRPFDPATQGRFSVETPPSGWLDMGWIQDLNREVETIFAEVWSGVPALLKTRGRARVSAGVRCTFASWSKLAMALSSGSQQMNLLRNATDGISGVSGGTAEVAIPLMSGSTASMLQLPAGSTVATGDIVVVDEDYVGQTGFVGSGIAGAYVSSSTAVGSDPNYLRRVSFNVARVVNVVPGDASTPMTAVLEAPLLAGDPGTSMKLSVAEGFADRTGGGSFVQEWSALFVLDGVQGDRVIFHYPRLQIADGPSETGEEIAKGLARWRLRAQFHAFPIVDSNDSESVLCVRSYLPAPMRNV